MLSVLPLWLSLNTYAFILDAFAFAAGTGAWRLFAFRHSFSGGVAALTAAMFLGAAIRVHLSYPAKLKTYHILYRRNRKSLHRASFYDFMGSPCYRMVVRAVLCRTGHPEEYHVIYKEIWGSGLARFAPKPAVVTIFHTPEEGARWLQYQNRPSLSLEGNDHFN